NDIDIRLTIFGQHNSQSTTIRRPLWRPVDTAETGDQAALLVVDVLHIDFRLLVLETHVSQLAAVRRPGRRHQRPAGAQQRLLVVAVVIGDTQLIRELGPLLDRDIGNPGQEGTTLARQTLIDDVGDTVCKLAHLGTRYGRHPAVQDVTVALPALSLGQLALQYVDQLEVDLVSTVADGSNGTDHDGLNPLGRPGCEVDLATGARGLRHLATGQRFELATAHQVVGDHFRDILRQLAIAFPLEGCNGNGSRTVDTASDDDVQ